MGKVLEKLQALPAVASLVEGENGIFIALADGYSRPDGARDTVVKTAHAARLWIQEASNGRDAPRKRRGKKTQIVGSDGEVVEQEVEEIVRYPGVLPEDRKPIWDLPKNFNPNDFEGRDAFRRGYAKNSHCWGESAAAREFEQAWEAERRLAEARAAKAVVAAVPDAPAIENTDTPAEAA